MFPLVDLAGQQRPALRGWAATALGRQGGDDGGDEEEDGDEEDDGDDDDGDEEWGEFTLCFWTAKMQRAFLLLST